MKRYRRTITAQYLTVILIIGSVVGFGFLSFFVMNQVPFTDHFVIPWSAGRAWLLEGENPYTPTIENNAQSAINESGLLAVLPETRELSIPLLTLFLYLPFSLMPYSISRIIWMVMVAVSIGIIVLISIGFSGWKLTTVGKTSIVVLMLFWLPSAQAILTGELIPIIIALTFIALFLLFNGQETTAGFLLALTFSSFPINGLILLFLIIWSISHQHWSVLSSFFSGVAFLLVLSWLILPSWFMDWAAIIFNLYFEWDWINTPLMNLAALLPGIESFLVYFLHAAFGLFWIVLLITALKKSGQIMIFKLCAVLIVAYLINIQNAIFLLLLAGPASYLVFRFLSERWRLFGNILSWGLLLIISLGAWVLVIPDIEFTTPNFVPVLSLGYPLFILFGLYWIRWWALRIPNLPYETL